MTHDNANLILFTHLNYIFVIFVRSRRRSRQVHAGFIMQSNQISNFGQQAFACVHIRSFSCFGEC